MSTYTRYTFEGRSGYIITPREARHAWVAVRHSALVIPWADPDVHVHACSEEYYFLLRGELSVWVAGSLFSLKPNEILMVKPRVPHAIIQGKGLIEHFGIRAPAPVDGQVLDAVPGELPPVRNENERELRCDWGYRMPLEDGRNRNCWLIGVGQARFPSAHLILAYLDFPTFEAANAGIGTRHRLHLHTESWEYYTVLEGTKTLQIEDELVTVKAGEILEIPPGVRHTLHSRQAPYRGFTFRVPVLGYDDKVEDAVS